MSTFCRSVIFLALMTGPALLAHANGGHLARSQLRISLTIVDSCDIQMDARGRDNASPRVQCSNFMPHRHYTAGNTAAYGRAPAAVQGLASPRPAAAMSLRSLALAPALMPMQGNDQVTVATVIF